MNLSFQIAKHFKEIHFGGNWTHSNVKDSLHTISHQQALEKPEDFNSIATLTFHMSYYVSAVLKVFKGAALEAKDELSFDHPEFDSQETWLHFLENYYSEVEQLAVLIESLPDDKWADHFTDEKYGSYYRNIHGMIEHTHYHLGQINLIKKLL